LRGLFRYFTGVGQVFIVTDNQFPDFLDEFGGRVQVISHDEIMGSKVTRPTYNSHAIESVLYKIKGLCEHYLYLNDDFIIASPACPADFFTPQGQAKLFYSTRAMIPTGEITDKDLAVDVAAINARQIFKADFDHVISRKFQHAPVATKKSVQQHLAKAFPKAYAATRKNRFRGRTDISPATSFYPHYAMMTGDGVQGHIRYRYYETNNVMLPFKLFKLSSEPARRRPQVLCLNAVGNKPPSARNLKAIQREMNSFLPAAEGRRLNRPWDRLRFHINKLILSGLKRTAATFKMGGLWVFTNFETSQFNIGMSA